MPAAPPTRDGNELDSNDGAVAGGIEERTEEKLCMLQYAAGRIETCPEARCPFWEPGGAVLAGGCAVERHGLGLEIQTNPQLTHWLLRVRSKLEDRGDARLFHQVLPPGLSD